MGDLGSGQQIQPDEFCVCMLKDPILSVSEEVIVAAHVLLQGND